MARQKKLYKHGEHPRRNIIGITYALNCLIYGMIFNPIGPISKTMSEVYGKTPLEINSTVSCISFAAFALAIPFSFMIKKKGEAASLKIAALLMVLGPLLRTLINEWFFFVHIGQFLGGAGIAILGTCQAKIAKDWFPITSRGTWVSMFTVINNSGNVISFLLPNLIVSKDKDVPNHKKKEMVQLYLGVEAGICLVSCILSMIAYITPEYLQEEGSAYLLEEQKEQEEEDEEREIGAVALFVEEVKYIYQRRIVFLYVIIQMIGFGLIVALSSVITDILVIFEYKEFYGAAMVIGVIVSGFIGAGIFSKTLIMQRDQSRNISFISIAAFSCIVLITFLGYEGYNIGLVIGVTCIFGSLTFNYIPMAYEQAMLRLPAHTLLTITILYHVSGQLFSTASTLLFSFLLNSKTKISCVIVLSIFAVSYLVLYLINWRTSKLTKEDDKLCEIEAKTKVASIT